MDYPFWNVGIGYGVLMAIIAVIHVFVSHFAIGGGLYLVIAETLARRSQDARRLAYLESLSKFFILVTLVFGALTGVAIWFIIGLLNPAATEVLIHNFVWAWAIEWTFFLVEIFAAIVYYYGWKRMSARHHLIVGWIYFVAAWLSLAVINGILSFMLTPGKWLETGNFWDGFFNPTYWSSLVFRTGICLLLAGVYAMLVASRQPDRQFKCALIRTNAVWAVIGLAVIVPTWYWFWGAIPSDITATALERMSTPIASIQVAVWFLVALASLVVLLGLMIPTHFHTSAAVVLMALALGFFSGYEWMRESIRKPFVIHGFMYGNATEVALAETYSAAGMLPAISYRTGDDGADLFRHACRSCHTIKGYKPLAPLFDGTDAKFIAGMVSGTGAMLAMMPPFLGTADEAEQIASHIWERVDQRPFEEVHALTGDALGEKVFEVRCGSCHVFGGFQDNRESLLGLEEEDYADILDNGSDYGDGMPDFSGTQSERQALIGWLQSLEEEAAP